MGILIVEDDKLLRETFEGVLRELGYAVASAENGQKGLEQIRRNRPCFIFIDLLMPVMNGFELIDELLTDAELSKIPIVAMTASWSSKPNGVALMRKPFRAEAAIDLIRSHCGDPKPPES